MFENISVNRDICGGKPCIKGTRIPVHMVLELIEQGLSFRQIQQDYYPHLSDQQIKDCIRYANALIKAEDIYFAEEITS